MKVKKILTGVISAAMAIALVGCGGGGSDAKKTSSTGNNTFTVGINQELNGVFSPWYYQSSYDGDVLNLVYQSLLKYDVNSELVPDLAQEMPTVSEDGLTYTFKIKEGVKFSNGDPLTSADVKYTFTVLADKSYTGRMSSNAENIVGYDEYNKGTATEVSGITCPDDYTVVFKVKEPQIDGISTYGGFPICSAKQYPEYKQGDTSMMENDTSNPLGTGPYVLNKYDKATGASLTKNPNFTGEGDYAVENIIIKKVDTSTEYNELEQGTVDLLPSMMEQDKIGQASKNDSLTFNHYVRAGMGYVAFNTANGATKDKAVRQALEYATDRQSFCDSYYKYDDASDEVKDIPLGYVPQVYWNPASKDLGEYVKGEKQVDGLNGFAYNMDTAKKLLDDAGWKVGADGIREKDGQKLEIKFVTTKDNSVLDTLIPMVKKSWGELGVDLKQTEVDFNTLSDMVTDDAQLDGWNAFFMATGYNGCSNTDSNVQFGIYPDGTPREDNYPRLVDKELNDTLNKGYKTADPDESVKNYLEAMKMAADDATFMPIYGNEYFDLYNKRVSGLETSPVHSWSTAMDKVTLS